MANVMKLYFSIVTSLGVSEAVSHMQESQFVL